MPDCELCITSKTALDMAHYGFLTAQINDRIWHKGATDEPTLHAHHLRVVADGGSC